MFTGLITELGRVQQLTSKAGGGLLFTVWAPQTAASLAVGDSVALSGACHTAVAVTTETFTVASVPETLARTTLGSLAVGDALNLELPLRPTDRLGGHFMTGHVDDTAELLARTPAGISQIFTLRVAPQLARLVVAKGSVALDGVSLTVASVTDATFTVALIPHTLAVTTLGLRQPGDRLNFEADLLAKHVAKLVTK